VARFKRLTAAEARTLTRDQLLDRILAEQAYWKRKHARGMTTEDEAAEKEFHRIMYASISPDQGITDLLDHLKGVPGAGSYFDQKPDVPDPEEPTP
jgi:hypothetical protein